MRGPKVFVRSLFVCAATALSVAPAQPGNREPKVIVIQQFRYQPSVLAVSRGATVEWKNADIVPHTATALDKKMFDSGQIPSGSSWRVRLKKAGTFEYICTLHPNMKGTLIVR